MERLRARAQRRAGRCDPHRRRPHRARLHARGAWRRGTRSSSGSAAYAELGDELARHGLEYLNTEHADGVALPRRLGRVPDDLARGERRRVRAPRRRRRRGLAAPVRASSWARPTSASACSRPSSGRCRALELARKAYRSFGRRGLLAFAARTLASARDWLEATFESEPRTGCSRRGCCTRVSGPSRRVSGFMTQVIALRDPARRHARAAGRRHPAGRGAGRDRARGRRRAAHRMPTSSAMLVARRPRDRRRARRRRDDHGDARGDRERHADSSSTGGCCARTRRRRPPGRPRRRFRYGRAGMQIHLALDELPRVGLARGRAPRAHGDGARHAGPRRRLARGQRGRARAAAGRGDDRRRPALRGRSRPRARRQAGSSGSSCRSCRGAPTRRCPRRDRRGRRDAGRRRCARPTPTASSRASARRSRTSSARRSSAWCSRRPTSRR